MTDQEAAVIQMARAYAARVRDYNMYISRPGADYSSPEYRRIANDMDSASNALVAAAEPLIEEGD
jgi:hypothetical protein